MSWQVVEALAFIFAAIAALVFLFIFVVQPITVIIHELGHAIPALLLTDNKVTVVIGSYHKEHVSYWIPLGRLRIGFIPFRLGPIDGCTNFTPPHPGSFKAFLITVAGPIAPLSLALLLTYITFAYDVHGLFVFLWILFSIPAVLELFNLRPLLNPVYISPNTGPVYNDGARLAGFFKRKGPVFNLHLGEYYFHNQEHEKAFSILEDLAVTSTQPEGIRKFLVQLYLYKERYEDARRQFEQIRTTSELSEQDRYNEAHIFLLERDYHKAVELIDQLIAEVDEERQQAYKPLKVECLIPLRKLEKARETLGNEPEKKEMLLVYHHLNSLLLLYEGKPEQALEQTRKYFEDSSTNWAIWNNMGYYLLQNNNLNEAIEYLNKAIELDNTEAYPHANLGQAKLLKGNLEEGLEHIEHSLSLKPTNATSIMLKGVYYLKKGEPARALDLFKEAHQIDPYTFELDKYTAMAINELNR